MISTSNEDPSCNTSLAMSSKHKLKKTHSNSRECDVCVSLVGPVGCGKSALLVKYITRRFIGEYDPFYEGCWTKCENCDGIDVNIQIMDTYDQERKNLEKYLKWSDALILVYSVTCYESFTAVQQYLEQIHEITKKLAAESGEKPNTKIILLGNKIDIERHRQVNKQEVESLVERFLNPGNNPSQLSLSQAVTDTKYTPQTNTDLSISLNLIHLESTSCEEFELVQNLFHRIIRDIRQQREPLQQNNPLHIIEEVSPKSNKSKSNIAALATKNRTKSPKHLATDSTINPVVHLNSSLSSTQSSMNLPHLNNYINGAAMGQLPTSKDGSLKKNKFPFLNKILNNKNF